MPRMMHRVQKKTVALLVLLLLILTVTAGSVLAYVVRRTDPKENTFTPVLVDSLPVRTAEGKMAVTNSGDTLAYLRAAVVINWVALDEEGNPTNRYHINAPVEGTDFTIFYNTSAWLKGSDGFWYYTAPVHAGTTTMDLVTSITPLSAAPEGYAFSVEVVSTGIQATPTNVVEEYWNVTVNGTFIRPN